MSDFKQWLKEQGLEHDLKLMEAWEAGFRAGQEQALLQAGLEPPKPRKAKEDPTKAVFFHQLIHEDSELGRKARAILLRDEWRLPYRRSMMTNLFRQEKINCNFAMLDLKIAIQKIKRDQGI